MAFAGGVRRTRGFSRVAPPLELGVCTLKSSLLGLLALLGLSQAALATPVGCDGALTPDGKVFPEPLFSLTYVTFAEFECGIQTLNSRFPERMDVVVLGESEAGRIGILGAVLPDPTEEYYHPFGLQNYAVTYTGYTLLKNHLAWTRPSLVQSQAAANARTASTIAGGALSGWTLIGLGLLAGAWPGRKRRAGSGRTCGEPPQRGS